HPSSGQNLDLHYRFLCQHPGARPPRSRTAPNSQQRWVNCFVRKGSVSDVRRHLARQYARDEIETACEKVLTLSPPSYQAVKRVLEQRAAREARDTATAPTAQAGDGIRPIDDYQAFFEQHAQRAASCRSRNRKEPR